MKPAEIMAAIITILVLLLILAAHAFLDAEDKRRRTQQLYNLQPRVKPLNQKPSWTGKLMYLLTKIFI
jgi:hypothetical protein